MKRFMREQKVKRLLKEIEISLNELVAYDDPFVRDCALLNIRAGGKRLRPLFVLLTAQYFGGYDDQQLKFAGIMELVHMSSLIHDDVNDRSDLRRGERTLNARYNNEVAVHVGDYILTNALRRVFDMRHASRLLHILAYTAKEMSRGELVQLASMFDVKQTIETYYYRIERKTAFLIATCCQAGAILSDATEEEVKAFYEFGYHLGMAFQIKDDLMDINPGGAIGKPVGNDLKNGLINLPTILLLQKDFPERDDIIQRIEARFPRGQEDVDYITGFLRNDAIIHHCEEYVQENIEKARNVLSGFQDNETRKLLFEAADYVYERSV